MHAQSHRFTHAPLHTIPHHRIAYAATYRKTKAAVGKAVFQYAQHGQATAIGSAFSAYFLKAIVVPYSEASSHAALYPQNSVDISGATDLRRLEPHSATRSFLCMPCHSPAHLQSHSSVTLSAVSLTARWVAMLECPFASCQLDCKIRPLLKPPALYHIAAAWPTHAFAEAVRAQPLANLWLPGSFGHNLTPS